MLETKWAKISFLLLRLALGWVMLYAGITKVLNPEWTAAGYLKGAKTFTAFYQWLTQPNAMPVINFVNEWGLTLLGVSLILGIFVRISSVLGAALMILYYFPVLAFPMIGKNSYIVDDHIIYALVLVFFAVVRGGRILGLDGPLGNWCKTLPICRKYPKLAEWWGNIVGW